MKVSACITLFNEEKSAAGLLQSLLDQTKKPDEIIVVDGGSTDNTVSIINSIKSDKIKLIVKRSTRAQGRNLSVKHARNELVAITDGDCIAKKDWLEKITEPFFDKRIDIAAGFYEMKTKNSFQKASAYFLGITPDRFNNDKFLPSTRSIAFRKRVWEKIGGFPESDNNSAEDTDFNYKAAKIGAKYKRVKKAVVEWRIPDSLFQFRKKLYDYAKWDAEYGIWWHPVQKFSSHNIKVVLVFIRYFIGILLLILALKNVLLLYILVIGIILYSFYAFSKVYRSTNNLKAGWWGIILQFIADVSVMAGFLTGLMNKLRKKII